MAEFPRLKTGAVCQYPLGRNESYRTEVIWFEDGTEQRYRDYGAVVRSWAVQLSALTEGEMAAIESFYWANGGAAGTFSFTDPLDGAAYPSCEFDPSVRLMFEGQGRGAAALVVRQRR